MYKLGAVISDETAEKYKKIYNTTNKGVMRAIESWLHLRKNYLFSIQGYFDKYELDHLIEIQRGLPYEPAYAAMVETFSLRLAQEPKDEALALKIKSLTSGQALMLTDWIDCYLRAEKKTPEKLEELRKELLK